MLTFAVGPVLGYLLARIWPAWRPPLRRVVIVTMRALVTMTMATSYTTWSFQSGVLRSWSYGVTYCCIIGSLFLAARYRDASRFSSAKILFFCTLVVALWYLGRAWLREKPQTVYWLAPGIVASQASDGFAGSDWEEIAIFLRPRLLPGLQRRMLGMMVWDDDSCNEKTLHARWIEQSREALIECRAETPKVIARVSVPKP